MKWIWILIKTILFGLLVETIWLLFLQDLMNPTNTKNIKSFSSSKPSYHVKEPIIFNIELKNASYLYLLSLSDQEACLFFPPKIMLYPKGKQKELFKLTATQKEHEQFYLLSSNEPLDFITFSFQNEYSCIERNHGIKAIERLEREGVEVHRVNVPIE